MGLMLIRVVNKAFYFENILFKLSFKKWSFLKNHPFTRNIYYGVDIQII